MERENEEVQITVLGQKAKGIDYDWGTTVYDLERRFENGQKYFNKIGVPHVLEEKNLDLKNIRTFKTDKCLIDNIFLSGFFKGIRHVFIVAGSPDDVNELTWRIDLHAPRYCNLPSDFRGKNPTVFNKERLFLVEPNFDLFSFESAEKAWEFLEK